MPVTITITYPDPVTGRQTTRSVQIYDDQVAHFLEFVDELAEQVS